MEWVCPACKKQARNPEEHAKHLAASPNCVKNAPLFGWQGDTTPVIVQKPDATIPQSEWGKPLPPAQQAEFLARWGWAKK
jgi:hypothetical protein